MNKQHAINKIRCFLGWYEDNFCTEEYLQDVELPDGSIEERWIGYLEHPDYVTACEALDFLESNCSGA